MIKAIQCIFTFYLCLLLFSPFHALAETAAESSQAPPETQKAKKEAEKSVIGTGHSRSSLPAGDLVTLNPEERPATLVIRNREIVTVRAEIAGLSPQARVEQFRKKFDNAVSVSELTEPVVKEHPPYGSVIIIDTDFVVSIAYLDIDPLGQQTHEQVVTETVARLSRILAEIREERSLGAMVRAIGYSLLASLALSFSIWLTLLMQKYLSRLLSTKISSSEKTLEPVAKLDFDKVKTIFRRGIIFLTTILIAFLIFTWLAFVLKQFPYTRPWGEQVWGYVLGSLENIGLVMVNALPNLFTIVLIVIIARLVVKLSALFINAAATGKIHIPGVYPETVKPTRRIIIVIIYLFALVAVYPYLPGSSSDAFKGVSVLVGLMVSIGGSGVINQALSGMVLMYTRAHQVGDYVCIGETEGVVTALDMLATKIKTTKKEEVTIPNSVVLSTSTKNYTRLAGEDGVILHTEVTIGYSEPWRKVHEHLIKAANLTAGLKKKPEPFVLQTALSDFYVAYQLNAYLKKPEKRMAVMADLHEKTQDAFNKAGIVIVSPHYVADPTEPTPPKDDLPDAVQSG